MIYFDNASTTFCKPKIVYKALKLYKRYGANIARGNNQNKSRQIIEKTRENLKRLVKADDGYEVFFSQSATFATNQIIKGLNLESIKNIYISRFEHNAVLRVVYNLKKRYNVNVIFLEMQGIKLDIKKIEEQFQNNPPDLVVISHVSNVCGIVQDYKPIFYEAKKYKSITILDMAQSFGMTEVNFVKDKIDIGIFAGHKTLYGFSGIGGAVIKKSVGINDLLQGGTGIDSASEEMPIEYPLKLEPGTQNVLGIYSLFYSTTYILRLGYKKISEMERKNFERLKYTLLNCGLFKIIDIENATSIISCIPIKYQPENFERFFSKYNLVVRIGLQCSPEAHRLLGTFPGGTIRFSISIFNTRFDFIRLKRILNKIKRLLN